MEHLFKFRIYGHVEHDTSRSIAATLVGANETEVLQVFFDRAASAFGVLDEQIVIDGVYAELA